MIEQVEFWGTTPFLGSQVVLFIFKHGFIPLNLSLKVSQSLIGVAPRVSEALIGVAKAVDSPVPTHKQLASEMLEPSAVLENKPSLLSDFDSISGDDYGSCASILKRDCITYARDFPIVQNIQAALTGK